MYDLEKRTFAFAKRIRAEFNSKNKHYKNSDINQVIRSSGSIGANYIEANETYTEKDLIYRLRIAKKEAKETIYWLKLLDADEELV